MAASFFDLLAVSDDEDYFPPSQRSFERNYKGKYVTQEPINRPIDWNGKHRTATTRLWSVFKSKHRLENDFQPLHGTHADRYARVVQNREDAMELVNILCRAVPLATKIENQQPTPGHDFVAQGRLEVRRYQEHRLAACKSKNELETHLSWVRVHGLELQVKWLLLFHEPFMRYLPGDYLMRHVDFYGEQSLVLEGVVPFTQEEYIDRLEGDVVPAVLHMIIAFVAFDPLDVNNMPQWCADLHNKPPSTLTAKDMATIHHAWDKKFTDFATLPKVLELQCSDSISKFCEMAWLLEEVEKHGELYPWSEGFKQLLEKATGKSAPNLSQQYKEFLRREAMECIEDGDTDQVLAYQLSTCLPFDNIFQYYAGHRALINHSAISPKRLADIRHVAVELLKQYDVHIVVEVLRALCPESQVLRALCTELSIPLSLLPEPDTSDNKSSDDNSVAAQPEPHSLAGAGTVGTTSPSTQQVTSQLPPQASSVPDPPPVVSSTRPSAAAPANAGSRKRKRAETTPAAAVPANAGSRKRKRKHAETTTAVSSLPSASDQASSSSDQASSSSDQTSSASDQASSVSNQASSASDPISSASDQPSCSSSSSNPPIPSDQPAPVKRGRGRPKKAAGAPKSPYVRKKPVSERAPNKRPKLAGEKSTKDSI